jgi:hypothetical protein
MKPTMPQDQSRAAATSTRASSAQADPAAPPWWRVGMVWLVVGGPALVVVASLATAVVAWRGADEVLVHTASAREVPVRPTSETPALTARNHAATAAAR